MENAKKAWAALLISMAGRTLTRWPCELFQLSHYKQDSKAHDRCKQSIAEAGHEFLGWQMAALQWVMECTMRALSLLLRAYPKALKFEGFND